MSTSSKNIVIIVASPTPTPTRRRLVINITRYLQGDTTCKNKKNYDVSARKFGCLFKTSLSQLKYKRITIPINYTYVQYHGTCLSIKYI